MAPRPHAAILLIGNELLSGRVRDENLPFLASQLWSLGVAVRHVEICRDDVDEIALAVRRLAPAHTWLFTTGGIGPTHDDVTMEGIARAFDVPVIVEPTLERLIRDHFGADVEAAHLRMAWAPEGAVLEGAGGQNWPTVRMGNVFVLPGVPRIMERKFARLAPLFRQLPLHRRSIALCVDEARIAAVLDEAAGAFPEVDIGSYPEPDRVLVTFESASEEAAVAALEYVDSRTRHVPRA